MTVEVTARGRISLSEELKEEVKQAVLESIRRQPRDSGPFEDATPSDFEIDHLHGIDLGSLRYEASMEVSDDA